MKRHPATLVIWTAMGIVLLIGIYVIGNLVIRARREAQLKEDLGSASQSPVLVAYSSPVKIGTPRDSSKLVRE